MNTYRIFFTANLVIMVFSGSTWCLSTDRTNEGLTSVPDDIDVSSTELYLSNNRLTIIQDGAFSNLTLLVTLDLAQNTITHIEDMAFGGTKVATLLLNNNYLQSIPNLDDISATLLTLNLDFNSIKQIMCSDTKDVVKLGELSINENNVGYVETCAFENTKIHTLRLYQNNLTQVPPLEDIKSTLKMIDINGNNIDQVNFEGLGKLKTAYLHGNQLQAISQTALKATVMKILKLGQNKLSNVPYLGHICGTAVEVHMIDNLVEYVRAKDFQNMTRLVRMSLEANLLKGIHPSAFLGSMCEELYLAKNQLSEVPYLGHIAMKLKRLDLRFNRIPHLDGEHFRGCSNLDRLYLSGNLLKTLPDFTTLAPYLSRLYINDLQLVCCGLAWLKTYSGSLYIDDYPCVEPLPLVNVHWSTIAQEDLNTSCTGCISRASFMASQSSAMCQSNSLQSGRLCIQDGYLLQNVIMSTNSARSLLDCSRQCVQHSDCLSVNFRASHMWCELNSVAGFLTRTLVAEEGYQYGALIRPEC